MRGVRGCAFQMAGSKFPESRIDKCLDSKPFSGSRTKDTGSGVDGEVGYLWWRGQVALVWVGESLAKRSKLHPCRNLGFPDITGILPNFSTPVPSQGAGRAICPTLISLPKSSHLLIKC